MSDNIYFAWFFVVVTFAGLSLVPFLITSQLQQLSIRLVGRDPFSARGQSTGCRRNSGNLQ